MRLCKWITGLIVTTIILAIPTVVFADAPDAGEVGTGCEIVTDSEGYTYVDEDGYNLLRFQVKSQPIEEQTILPSKLLAAFGNTDEFDTTIGIEYPCDADKQQIIQSKYVCPKCGKEYPKNNLPPNCAGTYVEQIKLWELVRDSFCNRLTSIYDEHIPHKIAIADFDTSGKATVSEYSDYSKQFDSLAVAIGDVNTVTGSSYAELFETVYNEVADTSDELPRYVIFVIADIPEAEQADCIELAGRISEYCGLYVLALGDNLDSQFLSELTDSYAVIDDESDAKLSSIANEWSSAVNRESTVSLPAGTDAVLTVNADSELLDIRVESAPDVTVTSESDRTKVQWNIGDINTSQYIDVRVKPKQFISGSLAGYISADLCYMSNVTKDDAVIPFDDIQLEYYTISFELDEIYTTEPYIYQYIVAENSKLPPEPEVTASVGYQLNGWFPEYNPTDKAVKSISYRSNFSQIEVDIAFTAGNGGRIDVDGSEYTNWLCSDVWAVTGKLDSSFTAEASDDEYVFVGWYLGDRLISKSPTFTPTPADDNSASVWTDREYTAVFVKRYQLVENVELTIASGSASKDYDGEQLICDELSAKAVVSYTDGTTETLKLSVVRTGASEYRLSDLNGWFVYDVIITGSATDKGISPNTFTVTPVASKVEVNILNKPGSLVVNERGFVITAGFLTIVNNVVAPVGFDMNEYKYEIYNTDTGILVDTVTLEAGESRTLPIVGSGSFLVVPVDIDVDGCRRETLCDGDGSVAVSPAAEAVVEFTHIYTPATVYHYAYINGYEDGSIRPLNPLTRAETAVIFCRLLGDNSRYSKISVNEDITASLPNEEINASLPNEATAASLPYIDVAADAWYSDEVLTLTAAKIFEGYPDGSFKPDQTISRGEFIKVVSRFFGNIDPNGSIYAMSDTTWSENDIAEERLLELFYGVTSDTNDSDSVDNSDIADIHDHTDVDTVSVYSDIFANHTDLTAPISRAEAVVIINYALGRSNTNAEYTDGMAVFCDNSDPAAWYYAAIQEAAVSHECVSGDYEVWTSLLDNPDFGK